MSSRIVIVGGISLLLFFLGVITMSGRQGGAGGRVTPVEAITTDKPTTLTESVLHGNVRFVLQNSKWDASALQIYAETRQRIERSIFASSSAVSDVLITPLKKTFRVHSNSFWRAVHEKVPIKWEKETFRIYLKYISQGDTVVDFGTWIGPTILYAAQLGANVFGIEADPAAFAEVEINLQLNALESWAPHVRVQPACVGTGLVKMKSSRPGNSMSCLGDACSGSNSSSWQVQCYPLETLFKSWNIHFSATHRIFVKIDVEGYECVLIPTIVAWFQRAKRENGLVRLPTMYISYHKQLNSCSDAQYESGIVALMKLYTYVYADCKESSTGMFGVAYAPGAFSALVRRCNGYLLTEQPGGGL